MEQFWYMPRVVGVAAFSAPSPLMAMQISASAYCTILINSAGNVTHYMPAKNLILAHGGNDHYTDFFLVDISK